MYVYICIGSPGLNKLHGSKHDLMPIKFIFWTTHKVIYHINSTHQDIVNQQRQSTTSINNVNQQPLHDHAKEGLAPMSPPNRSLKSNGRWLGRRRWHKARNNNTDNNNNNNNNSSSSSSSTTAFN
ncbi:hypothetical protein ACRALDRAFT_207329 [Sodiomyces alcalophilus JCM 7366]|uniref:uncharacterized protein n=1 Tax=Sodiomyces alcalophilus JCM 7366 TaxID=591952 RepID=UPI0039B52371